MLRRVQFAGSRIVPRKIGQVVARPVLVNSFSTSFSRLNTTGPGNGPGNGSDPNASKEPRRPTGNPNGNRPSGNRRNLNEHPRLRDFLIVALLGTAGFALALNFYGDDRKKGEMSQEEYEEIKKRPRRAFKKEDVFVVFVLGGPGSGKGTQCDNIVRDYDFAHLSAGDLLRAEQDRPGSQYGQMIKDYIKSGQIVPQEVTIALLKNAMQDTIDKTGTRHFLIDGFPRKMDQALTFEDTVVPSRFTLFFECPEQVMLKRLLNRGKTSGRADDNIDSIHKRFKVFVEQSMPVVEYFGLSDKVAKLRCDDSPEQVYANVQAVLKKHGVYPRNAAAATVSTA